MASKDTSPRRREVSPIRPLQYHKRKSLQDQIPQPSQPREQKMAYPQQTRLGGAQFMQRNQTREYSDNGSQMRDYTPNASNAYSALGDCVQTYFNGNETSQNTYSATSSTSASGADLSNSSSAIIGDFIPIDSEYKKVSLRTRKDMVASDQSRQLTLQVNPYEFDPSSPDIRESRQTRITDFIKRPGSSPASYSTPRMGHFKNAHSQDNTPRTRCRPTPLAFDSEQNTYHPFHRSPSSPDIPAMKWVAETPSPTAQRFAAEYGASVVPIQSSPIRSTQGEYGVVSPPQNRYRSDEGEVSYAPSPVRRSNTKHEGKRKAASPERNNRTHQGEYRPDSPIRNYRANEETVCRGGQHPNGRISPTHRQPHYDSQSSPVRGRKAANYDSQATTLNGYSQAYSPTGAKIQSQAQEISSRAAPYDRQQTSSLSKGLEDVCERDEMNGGYLRKDVEHTARTPNPPPSPKKRSRSPMKKLFGEKGFFGESPEEMIKLNAKKAASARTGHKHSNGQKKTGVMDKLKNKLGEIAEKADMTPKRNSSEKPKETHPPISIPPPEQARILMELEYMIAQTANNFLMAQFSQGRLSIDSIRKTVDAWESKGRSKVLEFMYDQATQRSLVNANLQELRFYGERACNHLSVSSMLYAWKNVATVMAVRTFCDADTVLKKLVFDIEQILELLGAVESIMMRVQTLREKINGLVRAARESTNSGTNSDHSHPSYDGRSAGESLDDPYDGLKLVPDHYRET